VSSDASTVGIAAASYDQEVPPTRVESRPQFDHLILAVPDAEPVSWALRDDWGLSVASDGHSFDNGLANRLVPLEPPEYLEILFIADVDAFARQPDEEFKARVRGGGGLLGWGLRTWDLDAVERELGVAPARDTKFADGSTAPWRAVAKPGSALGFPFYIHYAATPDERMARWRQRLAEVGHRTGPAERAGSRCPET
jgi:Glyoxalase-like domain